MVGGLPSPGRHVARSDHPDAVAARREVSDRAHAKLLNQAVELLALVDEMRRQERRQGLRPEMEARPVTIALVALVCPSCSARSHLVMSGVIIDEAHDMECWSCASNFDYETGTELAKRGDG